MTSKDQLIQAGFQPNEAQEVARLLFELAQAREVPEPLVTATYLRFLKDAERALIEGTSTSSLPPIGILG